ncbi:MAG: chorismate synthase [Clostridia bacterium]|nr:chorismate synthase [Clostridia bacterium]
MKNTFGNSLSITLYGESHGPSVGIVIDGLAPGLPVDEAYIERCLSRRRPVGAISTARREADSYVIESGVYNGYTTGTPVCIRIPNEDARSKDYLSEDYKARPGHADYTARCKYHGYEDIRGGGHFSGRITAALVAAGGILLPALERKGIRIATHIRRLAGVDDRSFDNFATDMVYLQTAPFPVLDGTVADTMQQKIVAAKADGDSVGGILETAVTGLPVGVGEPWFDTVEGILSHALFSIPAIKGVEFGDGFALADMTGSQANDSLRVSEEGKVVTTTNHNGGINGGITNGMPLLFRCAVKPTPTISRQQDTISLVSGTNTQLQAGGRHDPCIVHRAAVVVECVTALALCDLLTGRYGTDWLGEV